MSRYEGVETTTTEKKKKNSGEMGRRRGKIKRGSASSSIKARHIRFICLENFSPLIKSCYTLHRKSTPQLNMQTKEPLALFFVCVCVFRDVPHPQIEALFTFFSLFFFFLFAFSFRVSFLRKAPAQRERERSRNVCQVLLVVLLTGRVTAGRSPHLVVAAKVSL